MLKKKKCKLRSGYTVL